MPRVGGDGLGYGWERVRDPRGARPSAEREEGTPVGLHRPLGLGRTGDLAADKASSNAGM